MVYNRKEAAHRARTSVGRPNPIGMCQAFTRGIFGVGAVGDVDGDGDADAVDGWKSEPESARRTGPAPEGVPGAWSGGRRGFGHRATSIGNGRWVSTDAPVQGRVGIVETRWFKDNWGMDYLGWSTTMSGVEIPKAPPVIQYSELEAIAWNVYYGTPVKQVRKELTSFINRWNPDVFVLFEAINLYDHLDGLGYKVYQLKPRSTKPGITTSHNGNIVLLVRNDLVVEQSKVARMKEYWKGPRTGRPQDPRVYRFVKIKKQGVLWKIAGVHFPFGKKAQQESAKWVRNLIKITAPNRPVVVMGDYNRKEDVVRESIAKPVDADVAGANIDLAVYNNCQLVKEHNLGKHGSDHPAWRYVFKRRRPRRKK